MNTIDAGIGDLAQRLGDAVAAEAQLHGLAVARREELGLLRVELLLQAGLEPHHPLLAAVHQPAVRRAQRAQLGSRPLMKVCSC